MKTEKIAVTFSMKVGLPNYSSAEISVYRECSLGINDKASELRQKLLNEAKAFVEKEAKKIKNNANKVK